MNFIWPDLGYAYSPLMTRAVIMIHPNTSGSKGSHVEPLLQSSPFDFMSILHVLNSGYIEREADTQLLNAVRATQFCAVLAPPQSGKSSLQQHVSAQLMTEGTVCLTIDLSKATHDDLQSYSDQGQWFNKESCDIHFDGDNPPPMAAKNPYGHLILSELWHGITDLPPDHLPFWLSTHPTDTILPQLDQLLEEILLVHCEERPVVIFVDGLDAHLTNNASVQELLLLIRRCYNRRSRDPIYRKLTFCLLGNANPERLMCPDEHESSHNPFPVCQFIVPKGFTPDQAIDFFPILADVVANPHLALRLIVQLTGGQPLLTHQLCHLVRTQALTPAEPQTFDLNTIPDIAQKHLADTSHFQRVCDRFQRTGPLLEDCLARYQRLLLEGDSPITDEAEDVAVVTELCLAGLVVKDGNRLAIASPIYQDMFDRQWLLDMFNHHQVGLTHFCTAPTVHDCANLCK